MPKTVFTFVVVWISSPLGAESVECTPVHDTRRSHTKASGARVFSLPLSLSLSLSRMPLCASERGDRSLTTTTTTTTTTRYLLIGEQRESADPREVDVPASRMDGPASGSPQECDATSSP